MSQFNQIADAWLSIFGLHTLETSAFVLLVWLAMPFLRGNIRVRYWLWLLALAKLFVPPVFSLPSTLTQSLPQPIALQPILATAQPAGQTPTFTLASLLFSVWLLSIVLFAAKVVYQNFLLRRRLQKSAQLSDSKLLRWVQSAKPGLRVFGSDQVQAPVLVGFLRPKIFLPADWQKWPQHHLESVMAHIDSKDLWVLGLQTVAVILFGLNPLVWWLHARLNQTRELRCDETAVAKTGISAFDYSKLLYTFVEKQVRHPVLTASGHYFSENNKSIFVRLNHLLNLQEAKMKHKRWFYLLPVLLGLAILPFSWQCREKSLQPELAVDSSQEQLGKGVLSEPYDTPPQPIGGFKAIQENLKYPEAARKAGIEGRVLVHVLVDEQGEVVDTKILQSLGDEGSGFAEAAVNALKSVKWQPAESQGAPVKVWVAVPVLFKLH